MDQPEIINYAVMGATAIGDIGAIKAFIGMGAQINARNRYGKSVLHYAAGSCPRPVIQALIDNGANVNAADLSGRTALHYAVTGNPDTLRAIIESGADLNARDNRGKTAEQLADEGKVLGTLNLLREYNNTAHNNTQSRPHNR